MKIVHLSTKDCSGAGISALRLHEGLKAAGIESRMLVMDKSSEDPAVVRYDAGPRFLCRLAEKARAAARAMLRQRRADTGKSRAYDIFTLPYSCNSISRHPLVISADILTLRWVAGMIDYREFFTGISKKPVVWRISDMNPFTGGCHYSGGCPRYRDSCGKCPAIGSVSEKDVSKTVFALKKECYKSANLTVAAPSKWLARRAAESSLLKGVPVSVIPNGLDEAVFRPREKHEARRGLGLPAQRPIVLFGADYVTGRKGFDEAVKVMSILFKTPGNRDTLLVTFGPPQPMDNAPEDVRKNTVQLGYLKGEEILSRVYSAADVFIMSPREEAFGQTCIEAMACGTPVAAFGSGGINDIVENGHNGLTAESGDAAGLAEKTGYLLAHEAEQSRMGLAARRTVLAKYTLKIQAEAYIRLYEKMLGQG